MLKNYSSDDLKSKKSKCGRKDILCKKELSKLKVINADKFTFGSELEITAKYFEFKCTFPQKYC